MCDLLCWTFLSRGERQTLDLGRILGHCLEPGAVVALTGELGSGKTRLVQGIARGLQVDPSDRVSSPTFALIHEYRGRIPLYHMDFYRLPPGLWEPGLGLEEYLWGDGACVIEWADRVVDLLPSDRLDLGLAIVGARKREITFTSGGERHHRILEDLRLAMSSPSPSRAWGRGFCGR